MEGGNIIQNGAVNVYIEKIERGGKVVINKRRIPKVLNTIPYIAPEDVIGREGDIERVEEILKNNNKILLINGLGGIGKTTLAKALVQKTRSNYKHILWLDVTRFTREAFVFNVQLLDSLHLTKEIDKLSKEILIDHGFQLIINRLRMLTGNNLMIVDNISAEIEGHNIQDLLSVDNNWTVITTSRKWLAGFIPYELDVLQEVDAIRLFKYHYKREEDESLIKQILKDIDYHTLLIEMIAKTGQRNKLNLRDIAYRIKKKGLDIVSETSIEIDHSKKKIFKILAYLREIYTLSEVSTYEKSLLTNLSALPPVHIHYEQLSKLLQIPTCDKDLFISSLNNLHDNGWIMEKDDSYKVHQVVQEVLRSILIPDIHNCSSLFQTYLNNFNPSIQKNSLANSYLLNYAEVFIDYMSTEKDAQLAKLCAWIGNANEILGKFSQLVKYDKLLLKIRKSIFEFDSVEVAGAYNNLGLTYVHLEKFNYALYYQEVALEIRQRILPENHSYFGRSYINLNFLYERKGDFEKALQFGLKAKFIFLRALKNPTKEDLEPRIIKLNLARVYNNLGYDYQKLGDNRRSILYQQKSIYIREELLEPMDPYLGESYFNAANAYFANKKYNRALEFIKKSLAIREIILQPENSQLQKTRALKDKIIKQLK